MAKELIPRPLMRPLSSKPAWAWSGANDRDSALPRPTLQSLVLALRDDHRPFLTYFAGTTCAQQLSYAEFFDKAVAVAARIKRILGEDFAAEARIAVSMPNSPDLLLVYAASMLLNLTLVPINPGDSVPYCNRVLAHAQCKLLLTRDPQATEICPNVLVAELLHSSADAVLGEQHGAYPLAESEQIAAIFYTSGTTSLPKGVMLSHRALLANMTALQTVHQLGSKSIHYCVLPLFHVNAFGFSFLSIMLSRAQLILSERFQAESFWSIVIATKTQTVNVVPEVLRHLVTKTSLSHVEFAAVQQELRYFLSAASALSGRLLRDFLAKFPIRLYQGYGLSETVNFALVVSPFLNASDYEAVMLTPPRPSVGTAIPGNDVMIQSLDNAAPCAAGEVGEVVVRGWNIMSAYLENPEATAIACRDGWFHSGDLGYWQEIGAEKYFFICGRIKEVVKRNSETIYVQEVEEALQTLAGCQDSAVTGFSNSCTGEEVAAVVIKNQYTPTAEEIIAQMLPLVGFAKAPKVVAFVAEIPRTGSMKIKRRELSDLFAAHEGTSFATRYAR